MFELNNDQRKYFGLDPVLEHWDRVPLKGDSYRPETKLYFEGDTIRKHIISTNNEYKELQYFEQTDSRKFLLPKTSKGKPKKLTGSTLDSRMPAGIYLHTDKNGELLIGSFTTQTTFYARSWETRENKCSVPEIINDFITTSPINHLDEIEKFKQAKRKHVKYRAGDFFTYKINRTEYGFGRILFDINKARKKNLLSEDHGLGMLMGPALLIKLYTFKSDSKTVDVDLLKSQTALPSDYIMDNHIFYSEYEIIGHQPLEAEEFDFPMSYGRSTSYNNNTVFLQWGLIHLEKPVDDFNKFINIEGGGIENHNPYGYYGIGFDPCWDTPDIIETIKNNGIFDYSTAYHYKAEYDLRNPANGKIRSEIMKTFGLDPSKDYWSNCESTNAPDIIRWINEMK